MNMKPILSLFCLMALIGVTVGYVWATEEEQQLYDAGKQAALEALSEINTPEKINQRLMVPILDSSQPMTTLGPDPQSFNVSVFQGTTHTFLTLSLQVNPTQDVTAIIDVDSNFDGTVDYTYTVPRPISGVCSNGFVSCVAGTWTNCRYFQWSADGSGHVIEHEVPAQINMGACSCVNQNCGDGLATENMSKVLDDLGGGIVAALQERNPKFAISKVVKGETSIQYCGKNLATAEVSGPSFSGSANPAQYWDKSGNADKLIVAGEAEKTKQQADDQSYFHLITESYTNRAGAVDLEECITRREIVFDNGVPTVHVLDSCAIGANCRLKNKYVCDYTGANCIPTVREYNPTNFTMMTYCQTINGQTFCNDGKTIRNIAHAIIYADDESWYYVKNQYVCQAVTGQEVDPSLLDPTKQVGNTLTVSGNTAEYTVTSEAGTIHNSIQLPGVAPEPDCELACKVRKNVSGTDVQEHGTVMDYRKTNQTIQTEIRVCTLHNGCPVGPGEEVITDCACINSLLESISILNSVKKGGEDMVCSK